jgi:CheY-like chemotaxis protein
MAWMSGRPGARRPDLLVLVVEDDAETRSTLVRLVRMFGVEVHWAGDGEAGYRLAVDRAPDLILCDLRMPGLDRAGFVRRLRRDARLRHALIVAIGDRASPVDVAKTREAGFDGHIPRKVTPEVLARLLDRALDRQRVRTEDEPQGA